MIFSIIFGFVILAVIIFCLMIQNTVLNDQVNYYRRINKHLDEQIAQITWSGVNSER